jgi:hypothetical protein
MTGMIYQDWLLDWDRKLKDEGRKILLLQDNFSGHVVPETLTNICVINFEPNLTSHVQPNDQGIIRCFKAKYRACFIQRSIHLYESDITPSRIYDIDQLEAMWLAKKAWEDVDTTTIRNCWRKAKILPSFDSSSGSSISPSLPISTLLHADRLLDPIQEAENEVINALNDLEATGALQRSNRMAIEDLLNPLEETHHIFQATDQDICDAVMDARAAREKVPLA